MIGEGAAKDQLVIGRDLLWGASFRDAELGDIDGAESRVRRIGCFEAALSPTLREGSRARPSCCIVLICEA